LQNLEYAYAKVTDEFAVGTILVQVSKQVLMQTQQPDSWVTHQLPLVLFIHHHSDLLATLLFLPDNGQTLWVTTTMAHRYTTQRNHQMQPEM
jgi:hypothetical protein